jgi:translation initiation factor IF-3
VQTIEWKVVIKQIKLRLNIASNDLQTKLKWVQKFLDKGQMVKITVMLKGREQAHPERGVKMLEDLKLNGRSEFPVVKGKDISMIVRPL